MTFIPFSFYESYLLPKVKQDIEENKRLCVHLYEALIASMFRPEEFVSGVYLPWVQVNFFPIIMFLFFKKKKELEVDAVIQ